MLSVTLGMVVVSVMLTPVYVADASSSLCPFGQVMSEGGGWIVSVAVALMKCGLTARAAGAAITSPARNTGRAKMNSRRRRMLDHSPWGLRDLYTLSRQEGRLSLTSRAGGYGHHEVGAS